MVNKKTVWGITNIALRLLAVCLVVAALTALVFVITKDPIAKGEEQRKDAAIRTLFVDCDRYAEAELKADGVNALYEVYGANGALIGFCVDYTGESAYGGDVNMMVGVGADGKVTRLQVLSHAETFINRYLDDQNCYTGAELQGGATMSYDAIRNAILAIEALGMGGAV